MRFELRGVAEIEKKKLNGALVWVQPCAVGALCALVVRARKNALRVRTLGALGYLDLGKSPLFSTPTINCRARRKNPRH